MGVKTVIQLLYRTACNARYVVLLTQATHDTTTTATATTRAQSRAWLVKTANVYVCSMSRIFASWRQASRAACRHPALPNRTSASCRAL